LANAGELDREPDDTIISDAPRSPTADREYRLSVIDGGTE
jgi:hypothetical protein